MADVDYDVVDIVGSDGDLKQKVWMTDIDGDVVDLINLQCKFDDWVKAASDEIGQQISEQLVEVVGRLLT